MSSEDPIASFLWSGDPSNSSGGAESTNGLSGSQSTGSLNAPRTVKTVIPAEAVAQLVGGLTAQLKDKEEERADEASRREAVEVALHSTRTQFARTRSRLKRFQFLVALYFVVRCITAVGMFSYPSTCSSGLIGSDGSDSSSSGISGIGSGTGRSAMTKDRSEQGTGGAHSEAACSKLVKTLAASLEATDQPVTDAETAAMILRGVALGHCSSVSADKKEENEKAAASKEKESTAIAAASSSNLLGSMLEEFMEGKVGAALEAAYYAMPMDALFLPYGGINQATSVMSSVASVAPTSVGAAGLLETVMGAVLLAQLLLSYWFDYRDKHNGDEGGYDDGADCRDDSGIGHDSGSNSTNRGEGSSSSSGGGGGANYGVRARMKHGLAVAKSKLAEFLPDSAEDAEEALKAEDASWQGELPTYQDAASGLSVWHRPAGGAFHDFRFEVAIQSEPAPVFALAREVELMPSWNPFIGRGITLHYAAPPKSDIRAYLEVSLPWPLPKIAVVARGKVFDRLFPASANDSTTSDDTDSATTATSKNSGNSQSAAAHEKLPPPSLIVFAGSEGEGVFEGSGGGSKDEVPPGKKPPTSPTEVRRLWLRVVARATPQVTCKANTPLPVTAGAGASSSRGGRYSTQGWFGLGGGGVNHTSPNAAASRSKEGQQDPLTHFVVMARVKFPVKATPLWLVRFVVRTLAPVVVAKVLELLPQLMDPTTGDGAFPKAIRADPTLYQDLLTNQVRAAVPPPPSAASSGEEPRAGRSGRSSSAVKANRAGERAYA